MKIYLAGKWSDKGAVRPKMEELRALGHTVTRDWTQEKIISTSLAADAEEGMNAVLAAEVFIALLHDSRYDYRGTFSEIGWAQAAGKKVIIVCDDPNAYCTSCYSCFQRAGNSRAMRAPFFIGVEPKESRHSAPTSKFWFYSNENGCIRITIRVIPTLLLGKQP